jgi:thioredoxin 1
MNRKVLAAIASFCVVVFAVVSMSTASAEPSPRDGAVKAYKAKKYSDAAAQFQACIQSNPNDDVSHYYLALSYQQLNQLPDAQREYQWVMSSSADAGLKEKARLGLDSLAKLNGGSATASAGKTSGTTATVAAAKPKVIEFSATWCGPCKRFAPTFDKVAETFKDKIDVQKIDIDDKATRAITEKYNVQAVPTIVFLDSKGNIVKNQLGGMDEQELKSTMQSLVGR